MKKITAHGKVLLFICFFFFKSSFAATENTFLPSEKIEHFIVHYLDLSSFNNSLNPRRAVGQRTFKDLGLAPTTVRLKEIEFDTEDWNYHLSIIRRADINKDGLEDIEVCFTDRSKVGTYSTMTSLLLTRYSSTGYLIALKWELSSCAETK